MKLENSVEIDASKDLVWTVTMDVERWPQWTPTIQSVEWLEPGPLAVGKKARVRQPGLPVNEWVVTELTPGTSFAWKSRVLGMSIVAAHEIQASGLGARNLLRLEVGGFVATVFWPLLRLSFRRALAKENAGLKAQCETSPPHAAQ